MLIVISWQPSSSQNWTPFDSLTHLQLGKVGWKYHSQNLCLLNKTIDTGEEEVKMID